MSFKGKRERILSLVNCIRNTGRCNFDELATLCNRKCILCKNCFAYDGWCNTKITSGECMYYELKDGYDDTVFVNYEDMVTALDSEYYHIICDFARDALKDEVFVTIPRINMLLGTEHWMAVALFNDVFSK